MEEMKSPADDSFPSEYVTCTGILAQIGRTIGLYHQGAIIILRLVSTYFCAARRPLTRRSQVARFDDDNNGQNPSRLEHNCLLE